MEKIEDYKLPEGRSLGLKVVYEDGRPGHFNAPEDFRWDLALEGETEAPDWNSEPECGGGLHVWEWAQGDLYVSGIWYKPDVIWMAVEYETSKAVNLGGCVKAPKCRTIAVSPDKKKVVSFIMLHTPEEKQGLFFFDEKTVWEGDVTVGDGGVAVVRCNTIAKAGACGRAVAGDEGSAYAGYHGVAEAGDGGKAEAGDYGTATAGVGGEAISGSGGRSQVGGFGTAIVGDVGHAIAAYRGVAVAGLGGTAQVGIGGKAKAGIKGKLIFMDAYGGIKEFFVGKNGVKPDTFYRLYSPGVLSEVEG